MKTVFEKLSDEIKFKITPGFIGVNIEKATLLEDGIFEIIISSNEIINFEEMKAFLRQLNDNFKYKTKLMFNVLAPVYDEEIKKYLLWITDEYMQNESLSKAVKKSIYEVKSDGKIIFKTSLINEKNIIEENSKELVKIMKKFGFEDFRIHVDKIVDLKILEDEEAAIIKEIQSSVRKNTISSSADKSGRLKISDLYLPNIEYKKMSIEGKIFSIKEVKTKSGLVIMTFGISDFTEAIWAKKFVKKADYSKYGGFKVGDTVSILGVLQDDQYLKTRVVNIFNMAPHQIDEVERFDDAQDKRVELSMRTKMSTMDGIVDPKKAIDKAIKWGHKSMAFVDSESVQSFPDIYNYSKSVGFKPIFGSSMYTVLKNQNAVYDFQDRNLEDDEYVVFDLETTGLSPEVNEIIEFGAVTVKDGRVIDKKQFFMKPTKPIPAKITNITRITNDEVKNAISEKDGLIKIMDYIGNKTLVAHNAAFDLTFLKTKAKKYELDWKNNPTIDTLITSRLLFPLNKRFKLEAVAKKYNIEYDPSVSHRADYDAEVLAGLWVKQISHLKEHSLTKQKHLFDFVSDDLYRKSFPYEVSILAKNQNGLKELFDVVSKALSEDLINNGISFIEDLKKYNDVFLGSGGVKGRLFDYIFTGSKEKIKKEIEKFDYIEIVSPIGAKHKFEKGSFEEKDYEEMVKFIIDEAKKQNKIVVAIGDVRYLDPKDKIYHDVYKNAKGLGGVRHYLYRFREINPVYPDQHLLTTKEMLDQFNFLDEDLAKEIVVNNTNKIANEVSEVTVIKDKLFTPTMEGSDKKLEDLVYRAAHQRYGENLHEIISARIKRELEPIKKYGFSVIYWISHLLVAKSLDDGYLVGSRGSVGSSIVAHFAGITEVNPLDPHYVCEKCQYTEFPESQHLNSGYDLPEKQCPNDNENLSREGQKIPFETFLGFNADKVPDIDLNFSGEYQPIIHHEVKKIFGDKYSFRAGTISTVAEKTAFGYVKAWAEETNKDLSKPFIEFIAKGVAGTKRTTGQHPGGIIVIPKTMDVEDFTPINYPANDSTSSWKTTHFDFHAIHDNVLKLDLLGHDDPTAIKLLEKMTGINVKKDIPFNDEKIISLFSSTESLGIESDDIGGETTGAMGIPEFGTNFVRRMLKNAKVNSFGDLISVSGLSHGTDVWTNNAELLVKQDGKTLSDVISCRDNIMTDLMEKDIDALMSFQIMEKVRKGKGLTNVQEQLLKEKNVPQWYIDSLKKIKYMFPKAHATAYVMMAWRIAWFKLYFPKEYYATYFTTRADVFDVFTITKGKNTTLDVLQNFKKRRSSKTEPLTNKEIALIPIMELALEAFARGIQIGNIDLYKSKVSEWTIDEDGTLIPPFVSVDGLGESVAQTIIKARKDREFTSLEDLTNRTSINKTTIKVLQELGVTDHLSAQNQFSISDFF